MESLFGPAARQVVPAGGHGVSGKGLERGCCNGGKGGKCSSQSAGSKLHNLGRGGRRWTCLSCHCKIKCNVTIVHVVQNMRNCRRRFGALVAMDMVLAPILMHLQTILAGGVYVIRLSIPTIFFNYFVPSV